MPGGIHPKVYEYFDKLMRQSWRGKEVGQVYLTYREWLGRLAQQVNCSPAPWIGEGLAEQALFVGRITQQFGQVPTLAYLLWGMSQAYPNFYPAVRRALETVDLNQLPVTPL